jgi:hypothetical protein
MARFAPGPVLTESVVYDSFDNALVILSDGPVRWRIIRERSHVSLEAASHNAPDEWYEATFLEQVLRGEPENEAAPLEYPRATLSSVIARFEKLREPTLAAFGPMSRWGPVREDLRGAKARWAARLYRRH